MLSDWLHKLIAIARDLLPKQVRYQTALRPDIAISKRSEGFWEVGQAAGSRTKRGFRTKPGISSRNSTGGCSAIVLLLASSVAGPPVHARELTYAHVWASAPPEPFLSEGRAMLADGRAIAVFVPRTQLESNIGRHLASTGWIRSAYSRPDLSPCIIVIADDVPRSAIANLLDHEAAHCVPARRPWDNSHAGAGKPLGHLDACLATGLPLRELAALCMLDRGEPLQPADAARWPAIAGLR